MELGHNTCETLKFNFYLVEQCLVGPGKFLEVLHRHGTVSGLLKQRV